MGKRSSFKKLKKKEKKLGKLMDKCRRKFLEFMEAADSAFEDFTEGTLEQQIQRQAKHMKKLQERDD